ncbi:MAG: tetratricopeptide repeat protein [Ignavibacteriales bacterium]|nr:tetratricopeptide repeat protein [Ignavibacteriales bacterium]
MRRCSICGEVINEGDKTCPSCGAAIVSEIKNTDPVSEKKSSNTKSVSNKTEPVKSGKKKIVTEETKKTKSLSSTKLFYLVLFLILIGAIIVYSSGIFDSAPSSIQSQQVDPDNPHAGVDLNHLEQIQSLEERIKKNPNDYPSLLELAHLLNDSGLKERAIEKYNLYLKKYPKEADVLVDLGVCYFETGKNPEAMSAMEKALKINPKHQIANLNLGIVNMSAGNTANALGYWKKAIEIDSTNEIGQKAKELIKTH